MKAGCSTPGYAFSPPVVASMSSYELKDQFFLPSSCHSTSYDPRKSNSADFVRWIWVDWNVDYVT